MQLTKTQLSRLISIILIFGLGTYQAGFSQDVQVELPEENELTIDQVIKLSVVNNPQVKRAILSVENADEQVKLAWSEVLPEVTSSATFTRNIEIPVNLSLIHI